MKRLEGTTQFVEIAAKGKTVVSTTGEIGTAGETETTQHHNRAVAARTVMRRVAEYKAHGYRTVQVAPPVHPRDAILEAALRVDRDDPAPYQVYADWLQTQGSSIGKLIIFDLAKRREVADELRDKVVALDPDLATIEWKWGLWRSLRIDNADDPTNEQFDGAAMARPLFAHTLCGALEELRVGVLRWDHGQDDVPRFVEQAGMFPWAADLRSLHLGDADPDVDMAHHAIGKVGKAVSRAFPRLVALRVHSGDQAWRGVGDTFGLESLALPDLSSLVIETCSLTRERLAAVLDAALPSLATLELWFGSEAQHATAALADLVPLLCGDRLPTVRHLGLRNAELTDAIARAVATSEIAARLETLDLSMGTLGDGGASDLATHRARFPRLTKLVVDDNFLTPAGLAALRSAFATIHVASAAQKEPFEGDERYVSVAE